MAMATQLISQLTTRICSGQCEIPNVVHSFILF